MANPDPQLPELGDLEPTTKRVYHIAAKAAWTSAQQNGAYVHPSLATEGFIHLSFRDQVAETLKLHFKDQSDLVLLEIDPNRLTANLRLELSRNGEQFPHLYGPLNFEAVVSVTPLD